MEDTKKEKNERGGKEKKKKKIDLNLTVSFISVF